MKKIALMTCYLDNYGACLQAYALQTVIKTACGNCDIIRYSPYKEYHKTSFFRKKFNYLLDLLRIVRNKNYAYTLARKKCFEQFRKNYLHFTEQWYDSVQSLYDNPPDYDVFITGSDQLWNPLIHGGENNKAYFLDFVANPKKRIAYAPSIGLETIPESNQEEFIRLVNRFNALSVRELSGKKIVEELTDRDCRVVLDPTLLLPREVWLSFASKPLYAKPYIFCYLFGEHEYTGAFVEYIKNKLQMDIVTIPFVEREYSSKSVKIKNAGPKEFVSLIANASLVITDSFHATAFSINLNVPFYALYRNSVNEENNMNSRIDSILSLTELESRRITCKDDFPELIELNTDFDPSNHIIEVKRIADKDYLINAIGE